jgi:hypothetical protein
MGRKIVTAALLVAVPLAVAASVVAREEHQVSTSAVFVASDGGVQHARVTAPAPLVVERRGISPSDDVVVGPGAAKARAARTPIRIGTEQIVEP